MQYVEYLIAKMNENHEERARYMASIVRHLYLIRDYDLFTMSADVGGIDITRDYGPSRRQSASLYAEIWEQVLGKPTKRAPDNSYAFLVFHHYHPLYQPPLRAFRENQNQRSLSVSGLIACPKGISDTGFVNHQNSKDEDGSEDKHNITLFKFEDFQVQDASVFATAPFADVDRRIPPWGIQLSLGQRKAIIEDSLFLDDVDPAHGTHGDDLAFDLRCPPRRPKNQRQPRFPGF